TAHLGIIFFLRPRVITMEHLVITNDLQPILFAKISIAAIFLSMDAIVCQGYILKAAKTSSADQPHLL
ncbi:hypothetical protein CICLE_v10007085mg, partial [Citrus x clementina]